jgi:hypothetical protein
LRKEAPGFGAGTEREWLKLLEKSGRPK